MNTSIARFRNITMTQGVADGFIQTSEPTGIDPSSGRGWMLKRAILQFPIASNLQALSPDAAIHWALTRDSKAAVSDLNDSDTIFVGGLSTALTTSGQIVVPNVFDIALPEGLLVVEPTIYAHLDSTATGLTLTAHMRLFYEEVKLTEVEILRMLTQG